jgi:hypothetical protein
MGQSIVDVLGSKRNRITFSNEAGGREPAILTVALERMSQALRRRAWAKF